MVNKFTTTHIHHMMRMSRRVKVRRVMRRVSRGWETILASGKGEEWRAGGGECAGCRGDFLTPYRIFIQKVLECLNVVDGMAKDGHLGA
jgi:hypothetical protein